MGNNGRTDLRLTKQINNKVNKYKGFDSGTICQNIVWPKCVLFVDEIYNTQALFQRCGRTLMYILSIMGDPSISRSAQNTIKVD